MSSRIRLPRGARRCGGRARGRWSDARRSRSCRRCPGKRLRGRSPGRSRGRARALHHHEAHADARDHDPPDRAADAGLAPQLAREERDPPALVAEARQCPPLGGRRGRVFDLAQLASRRSWRLAISAEIGSCHSSVTPASISASAPARSARATSSTPQGDRRARAGRLARGRRRRPGGSRAERGRSARAPPIVAEPTPSRRAIPGPRRTADRGS